MVGLRPPWRDLDLTTRHMLIWLLSGPPHLWQVEIELNAGATMAGIVDRKRKLEAMRRYSGMANRERMVQYFVPGMDGFVNASSNWDTEKRGACNPNPSYRKVFETMLDKAAIPLTPEAFYDVTYEAFLNAVPSDIRHLFDPHARMDERICMFLNPAHHRVDLESEWRKTGIVDQRFMYVSRFAVSDWNAVVEYNEYQTYKLCAETLERTVEYVFADSNSYFVEQVDTIVILGAGSPSKDRVILKEACKDGSKVRVVLVDASFYMLIDTYEELSQYIRTRQLNCNIEMHCFDFTDVSSWISGVRFYDGERLAIFLLGGTVQNLREAEFFQVISNIFSSHSIIVIAGEFFEDEIAIKAATSSLLARYDSIEAKNLVLTAVQDLFNRELKIRG